MNRSALAYLLFVAAPAAGLAFFACSVADRDHAEARRRHDAQSEEAAERLARLVEVAAASGLAAANDKLDAALAGKSSLSGPPVAFLAGERLVYSLRALDDPPLDPDDRHLYALSRRGGESWEFEHGDPYRALDAYAFYLPRLRSGALRARLKFAMARCAAAMGETRLATSLRRELFTSAADARVEGAPLDLLAGLALLEEHADAALEDALRERLRERSAAMSTAHLELFARRLAGGDGDLRRLVDRRRGLEETVTRLQLAAAGTKLHGNDDKQLVVARATGAGDSDPLAVVAVPVAMPPLEAGGGLEARLVPGAADDPVLEPGAISRPVRAGGAMIGSVRVRDPQRAASLVRIENRRRVTLALVGFMVAVTLGGGLFLVRAASRERKLARLRGRLLANVSHELRTPLTSIRMFAEMLARDPLEGATVRRFGNLLLSQSQRLGRLVDNLLDFSRPAQDAPLRLETVDLKEALRPLVETFRYQANEKGVRFEPKLAESPRPLEARVNVEALEHILLNLLDNALKYGRAAQPSIVLETRSENGRVRVSVADNGPGIPAAEADRVFEEFHRLRYEEYAVQGAGLGLSIARRLARRMGAAIELESSPGAGSRFSLVIPSASEANGNAAPSRGKGDHPRR